MFGKFPLTKQTEARDCGVACLHMICRYYGKFVDYEKIKELTGYCRNGTSAQDIILTAENLGLRSKAYSISYDDLYHLMPLPCVVHWNGNHFVVVYKVTSKYVLIANPAKGYEKISKEEYEKKAGICIGCEPTADFKNVITGSKPANWLEAWNFLKSYISPYKKQISQIAFLLFVISSLSSLIPIITQSIIDSGIPRQDYRFIDILLVGSIALGVGLALGKWLQQSICLYFSVRVKISLMSDYIARMFRMPFSFFENHSIGTILQRNYDFDRIEGFLLGALFNFILSVLFLLMFGTMLYIYDATLFWIFLASAVIYISWVLVFWAIRKKMDIRFYSYLAQNETRWVEFITNISDVKSYSYGYEERKKWETTQIGLFKTRIKLLNVDQIQNLGTNLIVSIRDAILIYMAANSVIEGTISLGVLGAVIFIVGQLRSPLEGVVNFIVSWQLFQISISRISDVYKATVEPDTVGYNDSLMSYDGPIHLRGLAFQYSPGGPFVLHGINASFMSGKITALVGASGSGKSTLIKLLVRLYGPSSGNIYIGSTRLNSISPQSWRKHIGVITQDSTLVADTIGNNITFGRPFDEDRMRESVRIANIEKEIENLPLGYDTIIGERGKGISEGQKQRILLARAIYDNPDFLFLDEITSSLDARNEYQLLNAIRENLAGKTIVISAHRLSTIRMADDICVLKSGYVVEQGTHDRLVRNRREYYNMFKSQLNADREESES